MTIQELIDNVPQLWVTWKEIGINTEKEIPVMFSFYSAVKKESAKLADQLSQKGYDVTTRSKRMLIFLKGYEINAESIEIWTVENIQNRLQELNTLAVQHSTILEGVFSRKMD